MPDYTAAVAAAQPIFYRPERIVTALVARFVALPDAEYPGDFAVARVCYEQPIRMAGTLAVFELKALHWPMLNLLDWADRDRRAFADAVAAAVATDRRAAPIPA